MTIWSAFGRKWAALPSASAAYTLLGLPTISSFIQTLLDDADAATARTTLGAVGLTGNETVAGVKTFSSNPVVSGGGIEFPGTQVPSAGANTLDDYEEGTWTPVLTFGGGSTGLTYTTQAGSYTKIGRSVLAGCRITLSAKGSSTGSAVVSGAPFSSGAPGHVFPVILGAFSGMTGLTGTPMATLFGTAVNLVQTSATATTSLTNTAFTNTSSFDLFIAYSV